MKREIKFRGKSLAFDKFVYGYLAINTPSGACRILQDFALVVNEIDYHGTELIGCSGSFFIVDPETVGQYTGLKDKNGVEIYEGDIIEQITLGDDPDPVSYVFEIKDIHYLSELYGSSKINEVIGNIHENPELIK